MAAHLFKVGDIVSMAPTFLLQTATSQLYEVVRLLPEGEGELQYRVKGLSEPLERMVRESQLVASSS
jgi:hypothetical protein